MYSEEMRDKNALLEKFLLKSAENLYDESGILQLVKDAKAIYVKGFRHYYSDFFSY